MKAATKLIKYHFINIYISIHAAREGGDCASRRRYPQSLAFQSTPPVKAATKNAQTWADVEAISIHAAREGGDVSEGTYRNFGYISIHAAREGGDGA